MSTKTFNIVILNYECCRKWLLNSEIKRNKRIGEM